MRPRHATAPSPADAPPAGLLLDAAQSIHRYAPFGVLAVDREGRIVSVNPEAARLLGHEPEAMLQELAVRFFRAPRGEGHLLPGACAVPEEAREVEVVTRTGDVLPIGLRLLPLDAGGRLAGTVALFTDLRGQKSREEQWRRRDRLASLGAFAAGVAHEIRNPLAGIMNSAQLLLRRMESGDKRGEFAELILQESVRLNKIVDSLLQFARPAPPRLSRQPVHPPLERALALVREIAVVQKVDLSDALAKKLPEIYIDHDQLLQVVLNVLSNALQALEQGGEVRLAARLVRKRLVERSQLGRRRTDRLEGSRASLEQEMIEIRVEDNGPGIPAADLSRVFDPFFTTRAQGSGLGLSICQSIIREHGGLISIESVVGQGTTVLIDLPVEKRHGDRRRDPR